MSLYTKAQRKLEEHKCPECGGLGEKDDAEPGDISFRTWTCTSCRGTGFKNGILIYLGSLLSRGSASS